MKKLVIKIGKMDEDIKKALANPSKKNSGTHTLYLDSIEELPEVLSPKRLSLLCGIFD